MQLASTEKTYRRGLDLYLCFIGLVTLAYGLITARISRSWPIADWLINYSAGFVRRGFVGEIAYLLGRVFHVSPVGIVVVIYLGLYGVIFLAIRCLAFRSSWNFWVLAVLLSPATLSFQVLDATGGFRKELIYLAAFSLFVLLLQSSRLSPIQATIFIAFVIPLTVLSHESLICFAPYFFVALMLSGRTAFQALGQCAIGFLLGLGAAFLSAHSLGNLDMATQICSSLGYKVLSQGNEICSGGAIPYLANTGAMARQITADAFRSNPYFLIYIPAALLALAPLIAGSVMLARSGRRRDVLIIWCTVAICFLGSLILFVYATDWGRWIYIHVLSIAILLLYLDDRNRVPTAFISAPRVPRWPAGLLLFIYATLWTLPHVPMMTPRFGYVGLVRYSMAYCHYHPTMWRFPAR